MSWARKAYRRLHSDTDTDFARVFNVLMMCHRDDPELVSTSPSWMMFNDAPEYMTAREHVEWVLKDFGYNWESTTNRERADVRIYGTMGE
jgi:hypothetical protein